MAKTILLADDDPDDIEMFRDALTETDDSIRCHMALNGKLALEKLKEIETPDIIFLDINMPEMNGWRCLEMLKNGDSTRDIPVIMYSTSQDPAEIKKAQQLGALCFYTKPQSYAVLKRMLSIVSSHIRSGSYLGLCEAIHRKTVH